MEGSELEDGISVPSVAADENNRIAFGVGEHTIVMEFFFPANAYGAVVCNHVPTPTGLLVVPICFAWRYPSMN